MLSSRTIFFRPHSLTHELVLLVRALGILAVLIIAYGANASYAQGFPAETDATAVGTGAIVTPVAPTSGPKFARGMAPVRDIAVGEIITANMLEPSISDFPGPDGAKLDLLLGKEARRALPAGQILRTTDIRSPRAIRRGENVTLIWQTAGVMITAQGVAMADADLNGRAKVNNPRANKVIEGTAIGRGRVLVSANSN